MNKKKIGMIVILTFIFLLPSISAQQKVCCEKTIQGDYCIYTEEDQCTSDSKVAAATCEQTSYCTVGCCYSTDEGRCYKNVPKAECKSETNSSWKSEPSCDIPQCQKGCCVIGTECSFVTLTRCKKETSLFPYANMTFDEQITSEIECSNTCRSLEEGCCVEEDRCTFTTREACPSQNEPGSSLLTNTSDLGFHKGMLCSNDQLSCDCAKQHHTSCIPGLDEVFWFDSCSNKENIYSSDEITSYNGGYVLEKEESCSLSGPNDPNCGNCDYSKGNLCNLVPEGVQAAKGDYVCIDLNCKDLESSSPKKNGESWCMYDGAVGFGQDLVGSRHYRALCINSMELSEPCKDYREEMCVQDVLGEAPVPTAQAFGRTGSYIEAICRENMWEDCSSCNDVDECGQECNEYSGQDYIMCCRKKCCGNYYIRDCHWLQAGYIESGNITQGRVSEDLAGTCIPHVPPGFKFWEGTPTLGETTPEIPAEEETTWGAKAERSTTQYSGTTDCSPASASCDVKFERGGWAHLLGKSEWKCVENCHCLKEDWANAVAINCKSLGDCGAYYNFIGKATLEGLALSETIQSKFDISDVADWSTLSIRAKTRDSRFGLKAFWDEMWPWYIGTAATGVTGGILGAVKGEGSWLTNFGKGFGHSIIYSPIEGIVKGLFKRNENINTATQQAVSKITGNREITEKSEIPINTIIHKSEIKKTSLYEETQKEILEQEYPHWGATSEGGETKKKLEDEYNKKKESLRKQIWERPANKANELTKQLNLMNKNEQETIDKQLKELFTTSKEDDIELKTLSKLDGIEQIEGKDYFKVTKEGLTGENLGLTGDQKITSITPKGGETTKWIVSALGAYNNFVLAMSLFKAVKHLNADEKTETYSVTCKPWQAPLGGDDCEKCNQPLKACSEYRCKSLGQACKIVNEGSENVTCINGDPNDASSPIISPLPEEISEGYTYTQTTSQGNPGYELTPKIEPFTPVSVGIQTNEPSKCKYSLEHSTDFEEMPYDFPPALFTYKHSLLFSLPSELATEEALELTNGGTYTIYIRCVDGNGNKNERDYFIRFSIKPGPDLTPPIIELSSISNGAYLAFNTTQTPLSLYLNEPAECKYSDEDQEYETMNNTMSCSTSGFSVTSLYYGLYECKTQLNLKQGTNNFFFRCRDQPKAILEDRNTNDESFTFYLIVSDKTLEITSIGPSGELYDPSPALRVITKGGMEQGKAVCSFSAKQVEQSDMILFETTNANSHQQPLTNLTKGNYTYYILCQDAAGNQDEAQTNFIVTIDQQLPRIEALYTEASLLHITMSEPTTCEYSTEGSFIFGEGIQMTGIDTIDHEATLEVAATYVIICQDIFQNEAKYYVYP